MRFEARMCLGLCVALASVTPAAGQVVPPDAFRKIDAELTELTSGSSRPAVAVAVAHRGRIIFEAGYGFSDAARSIKTTPHTPFAVASVAKTVTATALMRLADRGAIDLDRPVHVYLPGEIQVMQGDSNRLTPAALAGMSGGIPHVSRHYWAADAGSALSTEALVREFGISVFPPGETFHYSNMSFGIIERLLEKVTNRTFSAVVEEEIFRPLGMTNSFFATPTQARTYAVRLTGSGEPIEGYRFTEPEGGAGLVASAHDLVLLGSFHAGRPIGANSILSEAMLRRGHRPLVSDWAYGLGMWATDYSLVFDGSVLGGAGIVRVIPSEELAVAVVTNAVTSNSATYAFVGPLIDATLAAVGRRARQESPPEFFANRAFTPSVVTRGHWVGAIYHEGAKTPLSLRIDGDSLVISFNGAPLARVSEPLVRAGKIRFSFRGNLETGAQDGTLTVWLHHSGDTMSGYAAAQADARSGLGWPRYIELKR